MRVDLNSRFRDVEYLRLAWAKHRHHRFAWIAFKNICQSNWPVVCGIAMRPLHSVGNVGGVIALRRLAICLDSLSTIVLSKLLMQHRSKKYEDFL